MWLKKRRHLIVGSRHAAHKARQVAESPILEIVKHRCQHPLGTVFQKSRTLFKRHLSGQFLRHGIQIPSAIHSPGQGHQTMVAKPLRGRTRLLAANMALRRPENVGHAVKQIFQKVQLLQLSSSLNKSSASAPSLDMTRVIVSP